jgi:hypothetical protein
MEYYTSRMLVRPEVEVYQNYTVYHKTTTIDNKGHPGTTWAADATPVVLSMARTNMKPKEVEQYMQHPASHKFVLKGAIPTVASVPVVAAGDRFIKDGIAYEVVMRPQNPLSLSLFTIFITEEVGYNE